MPIEVSLVSVQVSENYAHIKVGKLNTAIAILS